MIGMQELAANFFKFVKLLQLSCSCRYRVLVRLAVSANKYSTDQRRHGATQTLEHSETQNPSFTTKGVRLQVRVDCVITSTKRDTQTRRSVELKRLVDS